MTLAVDLDQPVVDQPLDAGAGEIGDAIGQVLVDPAGEVLGDAEAVMDDLRLFGGVLWGFEDFRLIIGGNAVEIFL